VGNNKQLCFSVFSLLFLTTATVFGAPAAVENGNGRIAGGVTAAGPKDFPYYVAVTVNDKHKCGGFIYNDRFVVTAASCIAGLTPINVTVTVGAYSLIVPDPDEQYIPALSLTPHESFNTTGFLNDDIALIQLGRPVVFDGINVWFLRYDDVSDVDQRAIVMGWGATNDGGLPYASRLRVTSQLILSNTDKTCGSYSADEFNSNYMICAEGDPAGDYPSGTPCEFDEGSSLVQSQDATSSIGPLTGVAVGIFSKNKGCTQDSANPPQPSVYTRLTAYYSWLRTNAGQQPAPTTKAVPFDIVA